MPGQNCLVKLIGRDLVGRRLLYSVVENTDEVSVETQIGKVAGGGFIWFGESLQTLFSGILEEIWRQKIYGRYAIVYRL